MIIKGENHLKLGELGEKIACMYLKSKGYQILETRFTNAQGIKIGEIDIIAEKENTLVFVEVKTRNSVYQEGYLPEANINQKKLFKLNKIAQVYLQQKRKLQKPYRFDAVSIFYNYDEKKALVKHIESIFL